MTPLVAPPTDNLYKFMAITGVLALAASISFPPLSNLEFIEKFDDRWDELAAESVDELLRLGNKPAADAIAPLFANFEFTRGGIEDQRANDSEAFKSALKLIDEKIRQTNPTPPDKEIEAYKAVRLKLNRSRWSLFVAGHRYDQLRTIHNWSWYGLGAGSLLMVSGFALWWFRVQRWQDKAIRADQAKPIATTQPKHEENRRRK